MYEQQDQYHAPKWVVWAALAVAAILIAWVCLAI